MVILIKCSELNFTAHRRLSLKRQATRNKVVRLFEDDYTYDLYDAPGYGGTKGTESGKTTPYPSLRREFMEVLVHIPFGVPIKNVYNTWRLYDLGYGTEELKDHKTVEDIQHEVGINGMHESFNEAAAQAILQLVIVFSTGRISYAQMISIPFSLFSLALGSSRVFFILRTRGQSDPDPKFKTTILHILPWELMIVINGTILWTIIGGLLGKYIFIGVLISFNIILGALYLNECHRQRNSNPENQDEAEEDFKLRAALTAVWLLTWKM